MRGSPTASHLSRRVWIDSWFASIGIPTLTSIPGVEPGIVPEPGPSPVRCQPAPGLPTALECTVHVWSSPMVDREGSKAARQTCTPGVTHRSADTRHSSVRNVVRSAHDCLGSVESGRKSRAEGLRCQSTSHDLGPRVGLLSLRRRADRCPSDGPSARGVAVLRTMSVRRIGPDRSADPGPAVGARWGTGEPKELPVYGMSAVNAGARCAYAPRTGTSSTCYGSSRSTLTRTQSQGGRCDVEASHDDELARVSASANLRRHSANDP